MANSGRGSTPAALTHLADGAEAFTVRFRGFDRRQVERFVAETGTVLHALKDRIAELEHRVEDAEERATHARFHIARAEQRQEVAERRAARAEAAASAPERTIDLARRTSRAVVADAHERADDIYEAARVRARAEVSREYREVLDEMSRLESLRLAVAAERFALDDVRADIRARISAAAAELNRIADSEYLLGGSPVRQARTEPPDPSPEMVEALREMVLAQQTARRG